MLVESRPAICGTSQDVQSVAWFERPLTSPTVEPARCLARSRERLLEDARYVDVVTGDPEMDHFSVGRMWVEGGG